MLDKEVSNPLQKELTSSAEALLKRKNVYLIGGISWALSTYTRTEQYYSMPKDKSPTFWRPIASEDFATFTEIVQKDPATIKKELKLPANEAEAAEARENIDKLQNEVYKKQERLIGGGTSFVASRKRSS